MSTGPGHVQRAILSAFAEHPDKVFTPRQLAEIGYPNVEITAAHRASVSRAMSAVLAKTGWIKLGHNHRRRYAHPDSAAKIAANRAAYAQSVGIPGAA